MFLDDGAPLRADVSLSIKMGIAKEELHPGHDMEWNYSSIRRHPWTVEKDGSTKGLFTSRVSSEITFDDIKGKEQVFLHASDVKAHKIGRESDVRIKANTHVVVPGSPGRVARDALLLPTRNRVP